ncbi:MAG: transmembrane 220 family protein [Acidobacteriota bacterium]
MWFQIVKVTMGLLLLLAVAVQYNDPDPGRWVVMYGLAGLVSLAHGRLKAACVAAPAILGAVALAWALYLAATTGGYVNGSELLGSMDPRRPEIEENREMIGLAIVAIWMAVLAWRGLRRPAGGRHEGAGTP